MTRMHRRTIQKSLNDWDNHDDVATAEFSKFTDILSEALLQHHLLGFEITQLEFHHFH